MSSVHHPFLNNIDPQVRCPSPPPFGRPPSGAPSLRLRWTIVALPLQIPDLSNSLLRLGRLAGTGWMTRTAISEPVDFLRRSGSTYATPCFFASHIKLRSTV